MKEFYCTQETTSALLNIGVPLTKVGVRGGYVPMHYTKPFDDPEWSKCDAYYCPTIEAVLNWFDEQDICIRIERLGDRYVGKICTPMGDEVAMTGNKPTREDAIDTVIRFAIIIYKDKKTNLM